MLQGEYRHNIDDKGRLQIPVRFKSELGEEFVLCRGVARGNGRCLWVFSSDGWENFTSKISSMSFSDAQDFKRFFIQKSVVCQRDGQGRMLIPQFLREHAGIESKSVCVLAGSITHAEIWNEEEFERIQNELTNERMEQRMSEFHS